MDPSQASPGPARTHLTPGVGATPGARASVAIEALEDRLAPAVVPLGPLQFEGDFSFDAATSRYSLAGGTAQLGLAPTSGEAFKPLLELDGSVSFLDASVNPDFAFTLSGGVGVASASASPPLPLWAGLGATVLVGADLVDPSRGVGLGTGGQPVAIDNGSATFVPDDLRFFDPSQVAGTTDAQVHLQGGVTIAESDPELDGLAGTVSGDGQFVVIDPSPPAGTLPGVQQMAASVGTAFELAGIEFGSAAFTASYSRSNNLGVVVAGQGVSFGLEGEEVDVNLDGNGMIVRNGAVAGFQMRVVEGFSLLGLTIDLGTSSNPLTVDYVVGSGGSPSVFAMSGDIKVSTAQQAVSTVSNKVFNSVSASFVADPDTGRPGLEIVGGSVEALDLTVNGTLDLFGLKVSPQALNVKYADATGIMQLTGGISVEELFKATATFGASGSSGGVFINTSTGSVTVDDLTLALTNVNLGVFKLEEFQVAYAVDPTTQVTTFDVTLMMSMPGTWRVTGEILIVDTELREIRVEWDGTKQGRIPIGDTGLFLTGMDATVENLDQLRDLTVSGDITVEFGSEVTIFGETCTLFKAVGSFSVDEDELVLGATVWLGAITSGSSTSSVLGTGSGQIVLDWNDQIYTGDFQASLLDGTFTYDADFRFDGSGDIWIAVDAAVNVPHSVPLIGGTRLGSMDFRFSYVPDNMSESYVAAWTEINLIVTTVDIGFKYTFDTKSVKVIGSGDVKKLRNPPTTDQQSVYSYTQEYDVPNGATSANLSVNFPFPPDVASRGSQSISVSVDGGQTFIEQSGFAAAGITELTDLDTPTSRNISIVDPTNTAQPPSVTLKPKSYILKLTSTGYQFPTDSAAIESITDDGNGNARIRFTGVPTNLKVGDFVTVQDSSIDGYNTEHAIDAVLDGRTFVTDQPYAGDATDGTGKDWQHPHFTATFYNPPPTIGLTGPTTLAGGTLQVSLGARVDTAFVGSTKIDLYLDSDGTGYDGNLVVRNVPYSADPSANLSAVAVSTLANLLPGSYYVYAVINDGTNTPVFSAYSAPFSPQYAIQGFVQDQLQQPQDGWTAFVDLNGNGQLDSGEPVSAPTANGGFFGIPIGPTVTVGDLATISNDGHGKALLTFTAPVTSGLSVGQTINVLNSLPQYNGSQTITAIRDGSSVVTDRGFSANSSGGSVTTVIPQIPGDTIIDVVLINPLPDYFDFVDGGNTVKVPFDGVSTALANFSVDQKSAIQGTVFNDLNGEHNRQGQPGLRGWLVFLDQDQNGRLDPGESYTATQGDGDYNFAPFTPQQAGTYYVRVALPTGAAALYTFEDVDGTYLYDSSNSPTVHGGTLVNGPRVGTASAFGIDPRPASGPSNNVLKLDGQGQFVDVTHHSDLEPGTGAFSVAGWVRFSLDTGFKQMIAASQSPQSPFEGWSLNVSFDDFSRAGAGDRKLYLDLRQVGTGASVGVAGRTSLQNDRWYHVAFSYDPAAAAPISLFVDGALDGSGGAGLPNPPNISTTSQLSFNLGNQGGGQPAFPMGGYLDEMGVWDSALSPVQVLALAAGGSTPSYYLTTPGSHVVTLDDTGHDVRQTDDSGNRNDVGALAFATVSGTVRGNALNSGGQLDPTAPLAGWTVQLVQGGQVVATTVSRADGSYIFAEVVAGDYQVRQVVPEGWRQTSPVVSQPGFQPTPLSTAGLGTRIAAADFDRDGRIDLAIASAQSQEVALLFGNGDGTFGAPVKYAIGFANAAQIRAADLNGDGRPDVGVISPGGVVDVLFNQGGTDRTMLMSPSSGVWRLSASASYDMVAGDFNQDGKDELAALFVPAGLTDGTRRVAVLGLGQPPLVSPIAILDAAGIAPGDLNGDGKLDLLASGGTSYPTGGVTILHGDGKGGFQAINGLPFVPVTASPAAVGDIDGDGRLDALVTTAALYVYSLQDPSGGFPTDNQNYLGPPSPYVLTLSPSPIAMADLDGDLKLDLAAIPYLSGVVNLYLNRGGANGMYLGGVPPTLLTPGTASFAAVVAADVDGDGLADLILTDANVANGASFVLLNRSVVNQPSAVGVATGQDATGNDFTDVQLAPAPVTAAPQLAGVVYDDSNGDGRRDAGDLPREGVLVYLDLDRDGSFDPAEPSTTTLAGGAFAFGGPAGSAARLADGDYRLQIVEVPGRVTTAPRQGYEVRLVGGIPDPAGPRSFDFGTVAKQGPVVTQVTASGPVVEGGAVTLSASFVHIGALGPHTVLVAWGDGTTSLGRVVEEGGAGTISASHVYADGGLFDVVVTVIDAADPTESGTAPPVVATVIGAGVRGGVLRVVGTEGNDRVSISRQGRDRLVVTAGFVPGGRKSFGISAVSEIEVLLFGGDDRAEVARGVRLPASVDGGDGRDWLAGGGGPTVLRGGDGNDVLIAGQGPALLLGGAGNDRLVGGVGRDFLIGGPGGDQIEGGGGSDLLVSGPTLYDDDLDALLAVWDEWRSGRDVATRAANIAGTGDGPRANGDVFLQPEGPAPTLLGDGASDRLRGGAGQDVYYAATADDVPDRVIDPSGRDLPRTPRRPVRPRQTRTAQALRAGRLSMTADRGHHAIARKPGKVGPAAGRAVASPILRLKAIRRPARP